MNQITRADYMKNSEALHHAFFSQFVTDETLSFVKNKIGMEKIRASKDAHLNDVVKWDRGNSWLWDFSPMDVEKAKQLGEVSPKALPSQSTRTCVGKAAARILLEREQNITL